MNEKEILMKQISKYAFAAHEWNLYLDTHPNDRLALHFFREMSDKANELKKVYSEKFAPITVFDVNSDDKWTWVSDAWPWSTEGSDM